MSALVKQSPQVISAALIASAAIKELKNTVWRESNAERFALLQQIKRTSMRFYLFER